MSMPGKSAQLQAFKQYFTVTCSAGSCASCSKSIGYSKLSR